MEPVRETYPETNAWCSALDWLCAGVSGHLYPSEGGRQCYKFLSVGERAVESILSLAVIYAQFKWSYRRITPVTKGLERREGMPADLSFRCPKFAEWRSVLLLAYGVIFGIEIGYKLASKQLIYLLNPCHVTASVQLFLLALPPTSFVTTLFRMHFSLLSGALLAIIFPVTASRQLPFEVHVYWIQHCIMLAVPVYLLSLGGPYTLESADDLSLCIATLSVMFFYHFFVLQPIGMLLEVNLNQMLCPAPSDPFYGKHYRKYALVHQSLYVPIFTRVFYLIWRVLEPVLGTGAKRKLPPPSGGRASQTANGPCLPNGSDCVANSTKVKSV